MQKLLKLITFTSLIFIFCFTIDSQQVNAAYNCKNDSRCVAASFTYGHSACANSPQIYFSKGEVVSYDWQNDAPGIMQVGFHISKEGIRVSPSLVAVRGGMRGALFTIPSNGYYYLFASCEGGKDKRCQGGGTLRKF